MATTTSELSQRPGVAPRPSGELDRLPGTVESCLGAVREALLAVVDAGASALSDADVRAGLQQAWEAKAGIDELFARLVSAADDRGFAIDDGASCTRAWLAWTLKMSRSSAAAVLAQATELSPRVEETRRAWATGAVSTEQASVIMRTINGLGADIDAEGCLRAENILLEKARELTHPEFRALASHVIEVVDPQGADARIAAQLLAEEARAIQLTQLRRYRRGDGTSSIAGRLPDLHADMLYAVLDSLASPRRAGSSTTSAGTGAGSTFDVDGRHCDQEVGPLTAGQRYGRALCELIEHLPTSELPQHGAVNATVVVTLRNDQLASLLGDAALDTGGRISAAQARRLACNANILPAVLGGSSKILDLGLGRRLFDRHQRLALAVRDRGCVWPSCDRPPAWSEAHHIEPWSTGGPTDLSNGCLLCSFHHHLLHKGEWAVRMAVDGVPELIPPSRIDPRRAPQRHRRFQPLTDRRGVMRT
jgi:hypothetical protein